MTSREIRTLERVEQERLERARMCNRLDDSIRSVGWSPELEGAFQALRWVLGDPHAEQQLQRFIDAPEADRRRDWIARGGDPSTWPGDVIASRSGEQPPVPATPGDREGTGGTIEGGPSGG